MCDASRCELGRIRQLIYIHNFKIRRSSSELNRSTPPGSAASSSCHIVANNTANDILSSKVQFIRFCPISGFVILTPSCVSPCVWPFFPINIRASICLSVYFQIDERVHFYGAINIFQSFDFVFASVFTKLKQIAPDDFANDSINVAIT
jgi:hypothetical protein